MYIGIFKEKLWKYFRLPIVLGLRYFMYNGATYYYYHCKDFAGSNMRWQAKKIFNICNYEVMGIVFAN